MDDICPAPASLLFFFARNLHSLVSLSRTRIIPGLVTHDRIAIPPVYFSSSASIVPIVARCYFISRRSLQDRESLVYFYHSLHPHCGQWKNKGDQDSFCVV